MMTVINARPGDALVVEGSPPDSFLVLKAGKVEVSIKGQVIRTLEAAQDHQLDGVHVFLGELAGILNIPHSATIHALTDCRVFKYEAKLPDLLRSEPGLAEALIKELAERLRFASIELATAKQQLAE
jgi:CRP-like cAMP-binding protein